MHMEKQLFFMTDLQQQRQIRGNEPGALCFPMIQISLFWLTQLKSYTKINTIVCFLTWMQRDRKYIIF